MDTRQIANTSDVGFGPAYDGHGRHFDFTVFFEDTILTIVPAVLFLIAAALRAAWLSRTSKKVEYSITRSAKLVICTFCALVSWY